MTKTTQQEQPLPRQANSGAQVEPCTLVIFGGSGDLTRRKLLPALYNLGLDGLLPSNYAVVGIGRKPWSDDEFRKMAHGRRQAIFPAISPGRHVGGLYATTALFLRSQ